MRAPYAALFSLVVAYSAYQNTGFVKPGLSKQEVEKSSDSVRTIGPVRQEGLLRGAVPLPAIAGGVCKVSVDGRPDATCGDCAAICPAEGLSALIEGYFRADSENDTKQYLARHWNVPQAKQQSIKFLIASLPDPVHTHMALLFDRGIETIQSAAQSNGYLFSRAWMPWEISTHTETSDFTVRMAQAKYRAWRESLPGLMIFQKRAPRGGTEMLFVFVVGETPTRRIHIEQFQNALSIRESILADAKPGSGGAKAEQEAKVLRVYGPAFSGSLSSLNAILKAQPRGRFSKILIRSGTVSSYWAVHDFCEATLSRMAQRSKWGTGLRDISI